MATISPRKIRELHRRGENPRVDHKKHYGLTQQKEKNELAKDVCAIANFLFLTSGKGYLVIGIQDKTGIVVGVNPDDYKEERLQQIVSSRTDPPPTFTIQHMPYMNKIVTVISLRRSTFGPHQLIRNQIPVGFPIRRGSINGKMSANEVFQAMIVRSRTFSRQQSDYRTLNQSSRYKQITEDVYSSLYELGFSKIVKQQSQSFFASSSKIFLKITKRIGKKMWMLYFCVSGDDADKYTINNLYMAQNSIMEHYSKHSFYRSIVVYLVHGKISLSSYNRYFWHTSSDNILVSIEPKIMYYGLGEGQMPDIGTYKHHYVPRFYVSYIKSKEDIKNRIELIINWIEQHKPMFNQIREILSN